MEYELTCIGMVASDPAAFGVEPRTGSNRVHITHVLDKAREAIELAALARAPEVHGLIREIVGWLYTGIDEEESFDEPRDTESAAEARKRPGAQPKHVQLIGTYLWSDYFAAGAASALVVAACARHGIAVSNRAYKRVRRICIHARESASRTPAGGAEALGQWAVAWFYPGWLAETPSALAFAAQMGATAQMNGDDRIAVEAAEDNAPPQLSSMSTDAPAARAVMPATSAAMPAVDAVSDDPVDAYINPILSDFKRAHDELGSARSVWGAWRENLDKFKDVMVVRIAGAPTAAAKVHAHQMWADNTMLVMAAAFKLGNAADKMAIANDIKASMDGGASVTQDWAGGGKINPSGMYSVVEMVTALTAAGNPYKIPAAAFTPPKIAKAQKPAAAAKPAGSAAPRHKRAASVALTTSVPANAPIGGDMLAAAFADSDSDDGILAPVGHTLAAGGDNALSAFSDDEQ
jgi:hypothetical protein